jgi:imidazolonepropionase-like amidohydrolase
VDLKKRIERGEEPGPRVFHCGRFVVSMPPLRPDIYPPGALERFTIMRSPGDAAGVVAELLEAGADVVKVKREMSHDCLRALCAAAAEVHLPVTFDNGDEAGWYYDALTAFDSGATGVEHLTGISFDDPAAVEAVFRKMLAVRAFAVPTLSVLDRVFDKEEVRKRGEFVRRFAQAGGLVVAGTDVPTQGIQAGSGLHEELSRLVDAGLTNAQALLAATGAAGRALGHQGLAGTIEAGAYADLVVLGSDPLESIGNTRDIVRVFKGGREVLPAGAEDLKPQSP